MTTGTLERTDLEHLLDDEPMCVNVDHCGRAATLRVRWFCGCLDLACRPCIDAYTARLAIGLLMGHRFCCPDCGVRDFRARNLSDLMTVTPL